MTENSISSEQILENLRKNLSAINATVDKQEASVVTTNYEHSSILL